MATKCSDKRCKRETVPPFRRCPGCRATTARYRAKVAEERPEEVRAARRAAVARRRARRTSEQLERDRERVRSCCRAWNARNPERKRASYELAQAVERGEIVRPGACDRCRRRCTPWAWGLRLRAEAVTLEAWLCSHCWWARRDASRGSY